MGSLDLGSRFRLCPWNVGNLGWSNFVLCQISVSSGDENKWTNVKVVSEEESCEFGVDFT